MSDDYGDTSYDSTEDSQTSDSGYADTGDTGAPELDKDGNPSPVPYDRFKESRDELRGTRDRIEHRISSMESQQQRQQQFNDNRYQQLQVKEAEKEIAREMSEAKKQFPHMEQLDVVNALMQNPNASVKRLAKRSHEKEERKYLDRLNGDGYTPKPRTLQRSSGATPVKHDFGEDLDAAEAAARERLGSNY